MRHVHPLTSGKCDFPVPPLSPPSPAPLPSPHTPNPRDTTQIAHRDLSPSTSRQFIQALLSSSWLPSATEMRRTKLGGCDACLAWNGPAPTVLGHAVSRGSS